MIVPPHNISIPRLLPETRTTIVRIGVGERNLKYKTIKLSNLKSQNQAANWSHIFVRDASLSSRIVFPLWHASHSHLTCLEASEPQFPSNDNLISVSICVRNNIIKTKNCHFHIVDKCLLSMYSTPAIGLNGMENKINTMCHPHTAYSLVGRQTFQAITKNTQLQTAEF